MVVFGKVLCGVLSGLLLSGVSEVCAAGGPMEFEALDVSVKDAEQELMDRALNLMRDAD